MLNGKNWFPRTRPEGYGRDERRICFVIRLIGCAVLLFLIAFGLQQKFNSQEKRYTFSTEKWDTQLENRQYMIQSLLEQYDGMKGMTKTEVLEILGTNTYTAYDTIYIVGYAKGLGEPPLMILSFDENDGFLGFTISENNNVILQYETAGWNE